MPNPASGVGLCSTPPPSLTRHPPSEFRVHSFPIRMGSLPLHCNHRPTFRQWACGELLFWHAGTGSLPKIRKYVF
ncbi:hypothetical protein VTN31DRAFT_7103 [Thermomyces dupontii]|uniref:uncharacterized protein n=1 Tax=Talaromyces thermophilus TaxID=28565 RepID=UPI0037424703